MSREILPGKSATIACRATPVPRRAGERAHQTAVLAALCGQVYSIERIEELVALATRNLQALAIENVSITHGDGSVGCAEDGPYDRILVTAGAPSVPRSLVEQLVDGGRLVVPVGGSAAQKLVCVDKHGERTVEETCLPCRFVRLIGEEGWS